MYKIKISDVKIYRGETLDLQRVLIANYEDDIHSTKYLKFISSRDILTFGKEYVLIENPFLLVDPKKDSEIDSANLQRYNAQLKTWWPHVDPHEDQHEDHYIYRYMYVHYPSLEYYRS